jgi:hypothetical protein
MRWAILVLGLALPQVPVKYICVKWYWTGDVFERKVYCLKWEKVDK